MGKKHLSIQKKEQCMKWFDKYKSVTLVRSEYRRFYKEEPPRRQAIHDWNKKFKETGSVLPRSHLTGRASVSNEIVEAIQELYRKNPDTSYRRVGLKLGVSATTVMKVFKTLSDKKSHRCIHCGRVFDLQGNLEQHQIMHTGIKPYQCSHCGTCFAYKTHLITHEKIHTGEKTHTCSKCEKCFISKDLLTKHQKIHTGEKPFKCSNCDKCFVHKGKLIEHQRIHTGEKPYQCDHCGKSFALRGNLNKHWRTHT